MITPLKAGDTAPHFDLSNQNGDRIKLSDFAGSKVLVYFYPKAMTPGCTIQAKGLRDSIDNFSKNNTEVVGISPDVDAKLAKFTEKEQLNFTLLSDPDHKIAEAFGVWGLKKFMGKEYDGIHRLSFLIDEEGRVEQVFDKFKTKDHHQVVLDYLIQ
jgi:peroxiredoxin Q/BCP